MIISPNYNLPNRTAVRNNCHTASFKKFQCNKFISIQDHPSRGRLSLIKNDLRIIIYSISYLFARMLIYIRQHAIWLKSFASSHSHFESFKVHEKTHQTGLLALGNLTKYGHQ